MHNTIYRGERNDDGSVTVTADGRPLTPHRSRNVADYSSTFAWGYRGARAAQLALAILLDATDDHETARQQFERFTEQFVATWNGDTWAVTAGEVREWLAMSLTREG